MGFLLQPAEAIAIRAATAKAGHRLVQLSIERGFTLIMAQWDEGCSAVGSTVGADPRRAGAETEKGVGPPSRPATTVLRIVSVLTWQVRETPVKIRSRFG
jgi:hypothetical protein